MSSVVDEVERLVNQFYSADNDGSKGKQLKEVNKLLTEAQNSREAWNFVWSLMSVDKSTSVQYFGASTLYHKLSKHISELDFQSRNELHQKLLECLLFYLNHNELTLITTRLISCLAVYILQSIDSNWQNAIQDIVNVFQPDKFSNLPSSKVIYILLQVLNSIAEEYGQLHFQKDRKIAVKSKLHEQAEFVLYIVHKVLSEENISDEITKVSMKCFENWSQGLDQLILPQDHSETITLILNAICNENTCHEASEALIKVYVSPQMCKHPKLVLQFLEKITLGLESSVVKAINETNLSYSQDLYTLFVSIGECYSRLILDTLIESPASANIILKYLEIILKCNSTPGFFGFDEFISEIPFNFWICFQDDIMASDENSIQVFMNLFSDIYKNLIDTLLIKVQYPPDSIYIHEWDGDGDREKFRCYRQDISDIFMYCFNTLHSSMLKMLIVHFNAAFDQIVVLSYHKENNEKSIALDTASRYLEAVYFAFSSVAENISAEESLVLPQIFSSLSSIPYDRLNSPLFMSTVMNFLSSFSNWLSYNTNYIPYVLSVIACALKTNNTVVLISSTMALKTVIPECQMHLQPYAMQIIALCEEHFNYPSMGYKEKARLMHTIATVLSIMPLDVIEQTLDRILVPILKDAEKILCLNSNDSTQLMIHINGILMILSNLFSKLDINLKDTELEEGDELIATSLVQKSAKNSIKPQPIYFIFEKVIPLFEMIASKYCTEENIVENLCECIKKTVVTLIDDIIPLLDKILIILHHIYSTSKSVHVLKISRQIFTLFHKTPNMLPKIQEFFSSNVQITVEIFHKDFRENTHLVQVFFEEATAILKKCVAVFDNPKLNIFSIYDFAIAGILLPEKSTIHHSCLFLGEFISQGRSNEVFNRIITERFDALLVQIFNVIGGVNCTSTFALEYVVEVIIALNQKYADSLSRTLNSFIDVDAFPTKHVTRTDKLNFVKTLLMLRNNKRKMKDVVKEFHFLCAGVNINQTK